MEEIVEFFRKSGMFFIATVEEEQPRVRPFGGLMKYSNKLYFNTNSTKKVYNQMMNNPKVELCAFNKGTWVRLEGEVVRETTEELKEIMFKEQPGVRKMYEGKEDLFEVFSIKNMVARKTSYSGEKIINFK